MNKGPRKREKSLEEKQAVLVLKRLGQKIEKIRKDKNLSLAKIAFPADLTAQGLLYVEKGERDPKFTTLYRIAKSLKVELSDLLDL